MMNGYPFLQNSVEVKSYKLECLFLGTYSECCIEFDLWIHLGTHISNTREAKAFALLSEEGIAKGIRRITAVTTDGAFKAMELAYSLEQEVNDASKIEGSLLEKVFSSLFVWGGGGSGMDLVVCYEMGVGVQPDLPAFSNYNVQSAVTSCHLLSVKSVASLQTVASLKSRVDSASIPAAKKADIRAKISILQVLQ